MEVSKKNLIETLAINKKDTGSSEVQIGLLTQRMWGPLKSKLVY